MSSLRRCESTALDLVAPTASGRHGGHDCPLRRHRQNAGTHRHHAKAEEQVMSATSAPENAGLAATAQSVGDS